MHDKECDERCKCRHFLFFFCHADRHADRKDQRQIVKNRASHLIHQDKQRVKKCSCTKQPFQMIRCDRRFICKRAAQSKQQAGSRKDRDRQHKTPPDSLKHLKNSVFHVISSVFSVAFRQRFSRSVSRFATADRRSDIHTPFS